MTESITQADTWGGWFDWTVSTGPSGEFRIEPRRQDALLIVMPLIGLIWLGFVWFSASDWGLKLAGTVIGVAASGAITAVLAWENRRQQRLGPFLVFDGHDLLQRHGRQLPLARLADLELDRQRDLSSEFRWTHFLALRDDQGRSHAVLSSPSRGGIRKLKQRLEQQLAEMGWNAPTVNLL